MMAFCFTSVAVIANQYCRHLKPAPFYAATWETAVCVNRGQNQQNILGIPLAFCLDI